MVYGCIYRIFHKDTGKSYIGQTITLRNRTYRHWQASDDTYLCRSIRKHGRDKFDIEILYNNIPEQWLNDWEIETIRKWNTFKGYGYNLTPGGKSVSGKDHPMFGKSHSENTKRKISESNKGRKLSEDHKNKISKSCKGKNKGRKVSKETRKKMSDAKIEIKFD